MTLAYIFSGFAVGLLVGLTGVGGGSLMTPILTLWFGVPPAVAVGTDLAFACVTKTAGTLVHRFRDTVQWRSVKYLSAGALPAAALTTAALSQFGTLDPRLGQIIRYSIAGALLLTVIALLLQTRVQRWLNAHPDRQLHGTPLTVATVLAGAVLGALVTVSSIGAGAIGAMLLILLQPQLTPAQIAGTDIAYAVPLTAVAALGHWWLGSVDWNLLAILLLGSVPGIAIGSLAARAVPHHVLRTLLATMLACVATMLLYPLFRT